MIERAGQGCAIGSALFERIHQPCTGGPTNRSLALRGSTRHGPGRALCLVVHAVTGFTNKSLRGQVAGLLGKDYNSSKMSYDLRRLRLHGLIARQRATNTYTVTPVGIRVAVFYTKLQARVVVLEPLLEADKPPAPLELRKALRVIDNHVEDYLDHARLRIAA